MDSQDLPRFATLVVQEIGRLNEGNSARYKVRLAEYRDWLNATKRAPASGRI